MLGGEPDEGARRSTSSGTPLPNQERQEVESVRSRWYVRGGSSEGHEALPRCEEVTQPLQTLPAGVEGVETQPLIPLRMAEGSGHGMVCDTEDDG